MVKFAIAPVSKPLSMKMYGSIEIKRHTFLILLWNIHILEQNTVAYGLLLQWKIPK
jgi:hypothetical protein